MKKIIFFLLLLCPVIAESQVTEIKVGQTLPATTIHHLLNNTGASKTIYDLQKGKYLLLDFWATYCTPCVGLLPKLDSLQLEFKNKLQIVSATVQDQKTIEAFFARRKVSDKDIFYITDDTILRLYFPYRLIPHFVWIDPNDKVIAITRDEEVTRENIQSIIDGKKISMAEKIDNVDFDYRKPFNPDLSSILYRSLLTKYTDGIGGGLLIHPLLVKTNIHYADSLDRIFLWNDNIASLFYIAFTKYSSPYPNFNRIVVETRDSNIIKHPVESQSYCYEMIFDSLVESKKFFSYMFDDLNRLLPFKATIEKRNIPCWIIINSSKKQNPLQSAGGEENIEWLYGGIMHKLQNKTMGEFMLYLNTYSKSLPVVDETGIKSNIDIELDLPAAADELDIDKLQQKLNLYGLSMTKGTRNLDVLVIKDK